MKPVIIKLTIAETVVHVNASQIAYYYPKKKDDNSIVTVIHMDKNVLIEVEETLAEIDVMIEAASL